MIITSILSLLLSTSVSLRRDLSILFNRVSIVGLIYCMLQYTVCLSFISKGVGLHGGLLHITNITQTFHVFIFFISILILLLTSFYPRKVWTPDYASLKDLIFNKFIYYRSKIINKMGEHMKIIEYPGGKFYKNLNYLYFNKRMLFNRPFSSNMPYLHKSKSNLLSLPFASNRTITTKHFDEIETINVNPWALTGFIDGDGSFTVSITKSTNSKLICKVQPVFTIGLHVKDLPLLY